MAAKAQKILVTGDVEGKFSQLFQRVEVINKKSGPFDMLLCVGNFFGTEKNNWNDYLEGKIKVPIATYILGPNSDTEEKYYPNRDGEELCPNVIFLGKQGILTGASNLKLMYLSGKENAESDLSHFNSDDVRILQKQTDSDKTGVDILITSEWPKGVSKYVSPPDENVDEKGSQLIAQLAKSVAPRYHFSALKNVHYERLPYRNHRIFQQNTKNVTRFLGLAKVGNAQKRKWIYAFSISPASAMRASDLTKQPLDVTECPYSFEIDDQLTTTKETPVQFFYDMDVTNSEKRKRDNDNFRSKRRQQWKPAQPTGPCWFCLGSPEVEKHLVVSIGNDIYLTLPKGGLVSDHVLICPVAHFASTVDLPEQALKEVDQYKNALRKFYDSRQKVAVFFERNYRTQHFQIQVVPVARSLENKILPAFKRLAMQNELKLQTMPDSTDLDVPSGVPYFYVELPSGERMLHLINKRFPLQFGREVMASVDILNIPDKADWKNCCTDKSYETKTATEFKKNFQQFDFTL